MSDLWKTGRHPDGSIEFEPMGERMPYGRRLVGESYPRQEAETPPDAICGRPWWEQPLQAADQEIE